MKQQSVAEEEKTDLRRWKVGSCMQRKRAREPLRPLEVKTVEHFHFGGISDVMRLVQ